MKGAFYLRNTRFYHTIFNPRAGQVFAVINGSQYFAIKGEGNDVRLEP
jgi:hypothetical protein